MIQILPETQGKVIATRADGKLSPSDYSKVLPVVINRLQTYHKVRWYFEMEAFKDWEAVTSLQGEKIDFMHANDFEKIAVVADKEWKELLTNFIDSFTNAEIKFFNPKERVIALDWIKDTL